ncbi:FAD-dependent oxidoreductase [Virgibacillus phasianinus]|uniref:FAD-dependent oxidoreductase n=1 Tax=Virgibacillus phasianinus TaxID=2017483 RepID=A0A220U3B2_9BACI|nr:FAD-dependent oxidoreductase [Virgibacillus phasianinus]ASK62416.1 FAD-dependent oxidoreductase [Virgibacillus phasianinus]
MKVIIIGSGIVGASAAYHLVKNNTEVMMIDKNHQGAATSAGAGIVCPWISSVEDADWYKIAKQGANYYPELISQLKEDNEENVGYKKVGALRIGTDSDELDRIENEVRTKQKDAPELGDIERLTPTEARELFPPLHEGMEAVFVSGAARVDGRLITDAMKRAAQKHGAKLVNGEAELIHERGRITGARVNGEKFYADAVLLTAGAWSQKLLAPIGIDLKVESQRGQIAHIKLSATDTSNWPVVLPKGSHYMLAFDDSRIVAGATRETGAGFDYRTTVGGVHEVTTEALSVAPGLAEGTLQEVRVGFRPLGPDVLPILGELDNVKDVVVATGLGASGLTMGPYVGALAASIVTGEEVDLDLTAYNPMRAIKITN